MKHLSFPGRLLLRRPLIQILMLVAVMVTIALSTQAQVVFDNLLDVGPPPSTLGIYNMIKVVDNTNSNGSLTNSVSLPNGGSITLNDEFGNGTNPLTVVSPGAFFPWGHNYDGKAYGNLDSPRIRLYFPTGIKAFYLYAKPLFIRGDMTVTAYSGVGNATSAQFTRTVSYTEAQFFGFHVTNPDDDISYITISSTSPTPYVGEFGVAYECADSAPNLTATTKVLTCTNPSSTLTAPAGGSNYTFTGPNSFSQSGTSIRATVTEPGTYSLLATLAGGCTARGTVTLTEDKAVPSSPLRNDGPLTCSKTAVTLTATNQNNGGFESYIFSGPNGFSQAGGSSTARVSAPGNYSMTIRGKNGCLSSEVTTSVTANTNVVTTATQPLFDLYNATGGANWSRKDNWLTGCTPCNWYGVTCDGNGRVTGLSLLGNKLVGTVPASISALSGLVSLELGNNNGLTGGIPSGIGSLTALQTLNLSRTQLGGSIPASLGQLTQLQNLLLNESGLTGSLPASLGNLPQLQNLQLYTNQLGGCFPGNYTALCGRAQISFSGNPNLPGGGDFSAFCSNGTGSELVISQAPSSATACVGSPFSFSFVARGAASYQWYKDGQRLAESGPVLSFSSVSATDAGTYQVYINYGCGSGAVQSDYFTLTVRTDGACPASDLVPLLYVSPGLVYGPSSVSVIVSVVNVGALATRGSITLRISRDPMLPLSLPASATAVGSRTVQNALWSLDSSDPDVYVLRSSQVLGSGRQLSVGLVGSLVVGNTRGQLSVSAVLESGSGGEVRITNNTDAEKMDYFNK